MTRLNTKIFLILLLTVFLSGCGQNDSSFAEERGEYDADTYLEWSEKMADSEIKRLGDSLMYGGSDPKAKWRYTTGLFLKSLLDLWEIDGNTNYYDYTRQTIDSYINEEGRIKTYKMSDYNLDKINPGKVLLTLYQVTGEEKYRRAADQLYEQLQNQPRTSEGGFWHKKRYTWQMWLDGIYMSAPFYARYALMFGHPEAFEDVIRQIKLIDMHTRDAQTGLRYHGWDESNKQAWADPVTGNSPNFWGRAIGWYAMALVDVLDYIPGDYQQRSQIVYILQDLCKAIKKYQDKSGLWYQVVDQGARAGNYLETSASAMFVYAIAKAVRHNYIDKSYEPVAVNGYRGLIQKMVRVNTDGTISLLGICSVAGLGGDPYRDGSFQYYISEPVVANDLKGVGPFIMAGIQMDKMRSAASE